MTDRKNSNMLNESTKIPLQKDKPAKAPAKSKPAKSLAALQTLRKKKYGA